ncbi:hypothetical protein R6Q59_014823 [Mikania micrantha]
MNIGWFGFIATPWGVWGWFVAAGMDLQTAMGLGLYCLTGGSAGWCYEMFWDGGLVSLGLSWYAVCSFCWFKGCDVAFLIADMALQPVGLPGWLAGLPLLPTALALRPYVMPLRPAAIGWGLVLGQSALCWGWGYCGGTCLAYYGTGVAQYVTVGCYCYWWANIAAASLFFGAVHAVCGPIGSRIRPLLGLVWPHHIVMDVPYLDWEMASLGPTWRPVKPPPLGFRFLYIMGLVWFLVGAMESLVSYCICICIWVGGLAQ